MFKHQANMFLDNSWPQVADWEDNRQKYKK